VSLSWTNEEDIDLEAFRVNKKNTNDTCNTKPQCCEGCKKETCEGVEESTDGEGSIEGLPGGTETITYCNTDDYSNMIFVSDPSEEGNKLPNSGAKLVITHGEEEQIIRISKTKPKENSKFWIAGCLTTDQNSFEFIELNEFTEGKPAEENPLLCYDRVNIEQKTKDDTPLENASLLVNIIDAKTSEPVKGAIVQASTVRESISRLTKDSGEVSIKVTKNGEYSVEASARGYVNTKAIITLDCPAASDEPCVKNIYFELLPSVEVDKVEIILEWGDQASNLDLHSMQINKESPGAGCETFFNKLSGCENTALDADKFAGGPPGGEMITISNPADNLKFTYMIFVKDNSPDEDELENSEAHITITDGSKSLSKTLPAFTENDPFGAKFWFVGCLRTVGESFVFASVDTLTRDSPYLTQKLYCDNLFKKEPSAGVDNPEEFCENVNLKVRLQTEQDGAFSSSLAGCGAACTNVEIVFVGKESEKTIFSGPPSVDRVSLPITRNGQYRVTVQGDDYLDNVELFDVNCDITKCVACKPSFVIPVIPTPTPGVSRFSLSWAYLPESLQLYAMAKTATGNLLIPSAASTIIKPSAEDEIGMVFVENLSKYPKFSEKADISVTITTPTGDISEVKMDLSKYGGQDFWIAGCYMESAGVFQFSPETSFLNSRPDEEVPDYCVRYFLPTIVA